LPAEAAKMKKADMFCGSKTNRQIDQLVYELYGFTDEEIKIAEG